LTFVLSKNYCLRQIFQSLRIGENVIEEIKALKTIENEVNRAENQIAEAVEKEMNGNVVTNSIGKSRAIRKSCCNIL